MRVLIADDHGIVRSGIRLLLERQPDIEVVAEAGERLDDPASWSAPSTVHRYVRRWGSADSPD